MVEIVEKRMNPFEDISTPVPMNPFEDVFEYYQSRGSKGMEIPGGESIQMKNPGEINSFFESGMENTEIGNPGEFILIPEHPSRGSKGKEIPELGSIQMKNPGGINSSFESGMENTEIGTRQMKNPGENECSESDLKDPFKVLFDYAQNRAPKGMENTEIGSTHMKNRGEFYSFSGLGLENTEIGSTQMKNCRMFDNTAYAAVDLSFTDHCSNKVVLDWVRRDGLKNFAGGYRRQYIYDSCMERKTCIWSGCTYPWHGKSSRIMWVGVHGMDSICVVTRDRDWDMIRVDGGLQRHGTKYFRRAIISEIEDIADPDTYSVLRQRCDKGIKKPFGVVSVIPHTDEVHKESGHEVSNDEYVEKLMFLGYELERIQPPVGYDEKEIKEFKEIKRKLDSTITEAIFQASSKAEHDEKKAIEFLQEKMRSNISFTLNETIQTAISAFQHLFQKKFKANEIQVSVIDPDYFITPEEANNYYKDPYVKELEMSDIEEHLAVINEPGRGGSGSKSIGSGSSREALKADALGRLWKQITFL